MHKYIFVLNGLKYQLKGDSSEIAEGHRAVVREYGDRDGKVACDVHGAEGPRHGELAKRIPKRFEEVPTEIKFL